MIEKLVAKLRGYDHVGVAEEQALAGLFAAERVYGRGDVFTRTGDRLDVSTLLLSGFVHRFKDLSDGRRQSLELSVPGDFVDLHAFSLKRIDHDIRCLSPCRVALAPHERIRKLSADFPHLTRLLWLSTTIDAALHRERIVSLGARTAVERLAHFVCETHARLRAVGLADGDCFALPLTQGDLSELMGLSMVHMNRTIRDLRERGLAELSARQVRIGDWNGLTGLAQFDAGYLGRHKEPR